MSIRTLIPCTLALALSGSAWAQDTDAPTEAAEPTAETTSPDSTSRLRQPLRYEQSFKAARTIGQVGLGTMGLGGVMVAGGTAGMVIGGFTALVMLDTEPGIYPIAQYGAYTALGGLAVTSVGGVILGTSVIGTSLTLNRMGVTVPYYGLMTTGAGLVGITGMSLIKSAQDPSNEGSVFRLATDRLVSSVYAASLVAVPGGLVWQFILSNNAYREYKQGLTSVRLVPSLSPTSPGLTLQASF